MAGSIKNLTGFMIPTDNLTTKPGIEFDCLIAHEDREKAPIC
jgi:hypothetical protein